MDQKRHFPIARLAQQKKYWNEAIASPGNGEGDTKRQNINFINPIEIKVSGPKAIILFLSSPYQRDKNMSIPNIVFPLNYLPLVGGHHFVLKQFNLICLANRNCGNDSTSFFSILLDWPMIQNAAKSFSSTKTIQAITLKIPIQSYNLVLWCQNNQFINCKIPIGNLSIQPYNTNAVKPLTIMVAIQIHLA